MNEVSRTHDRDKTQIDTNDFKALELAEALQRDMELRGRPGQLIVWSSNYARAYVYAGEWVADCPSRCGNVELLTIKRDTDRGRAGSKGTRRESFICSYCHQIANSIHWPENADEIMEILDRRPIPHNRHWYPEGHITALEFGIPDGQTVEELLAENEAHGIS